MKKWFSFLVVIFLGWLLSGCSVKEKAETGSFPDDESGKGNLILSSADRKIIFQSLRYHLHRRKLFRQIKSFKAEFECG